MNQADRLEAIKAFIAEHVSNDREISISGDDTDTLFELLDAAIERENGIVQIPQLTMEQLAEKFGRKP